MDNKTASNANSPTQGNTKKINQKEVRLEKIPVSTIGEVNGKKIVVPQHVNYNSKSDRVNIHWNDKAITSISREYLLKNLNMELNHRPGGSDVSFPVPKEQNSSVAMRVTREKSNVLFVQPGGIKYNLVSNSLDLVLGKEHICSITNERMKAIGLEMKLVEKKRVLER